LEVDVPNHLLVDLYEHTMACAFWADGMSSRPASFSLFVRRLAPRRGCLVAAGLHDVLGWLETLRFEPRELEALAAVHPFPEAYLDYLASLRFTGTVRAVREGTVVFPGEPILEIDAPVCEAQLAETFALNQVTVQTVLATKAARCRDAAAGRAVVDFALRRTHGIDAGMKLARICRVVGLAGTSNVAGASRYHVAASGTMAHSFVEAYPHETDAFRSFTRTFGNDSVLLVDTYDTRRGIERAIEVAQELRARGDELRAIRLDSGDLGGWAHVARERLDESGFPAVQIFASGGLDEYRIARLVDDGAPIDAFGVGTALGVSDDAPALDAVYKLVEFDGRAVRKTSEQKEIWPGRKQVWRRRDFAEDVIGLADEGPPGDDYEPLLEVVMRDGVRTDAGRRDLAEINRHFESQWPCVPERVRRLVRPGRYRVRQSAALRALTLVVDEELAARTS
jgi:nicotinate phosphoribosyltransferase